MVIYLKCTFMEQSNESIKNIFYDIPTDNGSILLPGILILQIEEDKLLYKTVPLNHSGKDGDGVGKRYEYDGKPTSLAQVLLS